MTMISILFPSNYLDLRLQIRSAMRLITRARDQKQEQ